LRQGRQLGLAASSAFKLTSNDVNLKRKNISFPIKQIAMNKGSLENPGTKHILSSFAHKLIVDLLFQNCHLMV
jgi:hypothetical protein